MTKNELYKELYFLEGQVKKARTKRAILTVGFFSVVYFLLFVYQNRPTDLIDLLGNILGAVFIGGIHFWLNGIVFSTLCTKSQAEDKAIEHLQKQIREFDTSSGQE